MHCWTDEIETAVNSTVDNISSVQTTFVLQVLLKLSVNVLNDRIEAKHSADHIRRSTVENCITK